MSTTSLPPVSRQPRPPAAVIPAVALPTAEPPPFNVPLTLLAEAEGQTDILHGFHDGEAWYAYDLPTTCLRQASGACSRGRRATAGRRACRTAYACRVPRRCTRPAGCCPDPPGRDAAGAWMVRLVRFERTTYRLQGGCSTS